MIIEKKNYGRCIMMIILDHTTNSIVHRRAETSSVLYEIITTEVYSITSISFTTSINLVPLRSELGRLNRDSWA
jgi:hypothetical protein